MAKEFFIDGIGNISIQGPVVTLSMIRSTQGNQPEQTNDEEILKLTMTGQNLVKMTNILGNTLKRIAERNKENQDKLGKSEESPSTKGSNPVKKNKSVNWN